MTNPGRIPNVQDISNSTGCSRNASTAQLRQTVHASPPVIEPRDVCRQEMHPRYRLTVNRAEGARHGTPPSRGSHPKNGCADQVSCHRYDCARVAGWPLPNRFRALWRIRLCGPLHGRGNIAPTGVANIEGNQMEISSENIQAWGTLFAVLVAIVALIYTIRSDRQMRRRTDLYEVNDRLIEMGREFDKVKNSLSTTKEKYRQIFEETKEGHHSAEEAHKKRDEIIRGLIDREAQAADEIYEIVRRYRYVYSAAEIETIKAYVHSIQSSDAPDTQENTFKVVSELIEKIQRIIRYAEEVTESKVENVAKKLRKLD